MIMGGGKVGSYLARDLSDKGHAVRIIERARELAERLKQEIALEVVIGDGCDLSRQEEADMGKADVFAAVTGDDDNNLVACQLARTYFNVPHVVARVNEPKNESTFNRLGVEGISSTSVIAQVIEERTTMGDIITLLTLKKGRLAVVELDLPSDRCRCCDVPLRDLGLPRSCVLVSIIREEDVIIPGGDVSLRPGDTVIAVTEPANEGELKRILIG